MNMPPLQFATTNRVRMGYYEAGPNCRFPGGIRSGHSPTRASASIAPDQRGYGATDRPEPVEAYELEHLTADLVGLLDHLKIDKAIFVGHDWGGDGPAEASAR
jgi:pimeloyl-ACP methyl ester carboxylesterase